MKIVHVIPISKGMSKERLSYFSPADLKPGTLVSVPLRSRLVHALVTGSDDATNLKSELRSSPFALKKVHKAHEGAFLSTDFVKACEETADHFATTTGAVLSSVVPKAIFDNIKKIRRPRQQAAEHHYEKLALQTHDEERFSHYKSLIREEFARKRSVFFCLPTIQDIRRIKPTLEKGIEQYAFGLHSKLTAKNTVDTWNKIAMTEHPVLIIGTPQFLSLHRPDLKTIIVEKEASRSYKTQSRPRIDLRIFAEKLAKQSSSRIVIGDHLLRTETIYEIRNDTYVELSPMKFRSLSSAKTSLVDMRPEADEKNKRFRIFSDELEELIAATKENNERLFLFGARKGFATTTVCADCGETVRCTACGAPVVLYARNVEENYFFCNKCGEKRSAHERCVVCESWNLTMLGIGVERIEAELEARFPNIKIFRLDKESVTTERRALEIAAKFDSSPGSVLIGTELALAYIVEPVENTAVISIDSLFAVPDFRVNEKLFRTLLEIRRLAEKRFVLQTRNAAEQIFSLAAQGNIMDFYRSEIEDRKRFQYPPFSIFIKITFEGARAAVETEMRKLKEFLEPDQADLLQEFEPPASRIGTKKFAMHALLKIPSNEWPKMSLVSKLRELPPHFMIKVDPDALL